MTKKSIKIVFFFFCILVGGALIFFYQPILLFISSHMTKKDEAQIILHQLQSNALSGKNIDNQQKNILSDKLETINTNFQEYINEINDIFLSLGVDKEKQTSILNDFALVAPTDYFSTHLDSILGTPLNQNDGLKKLLTLVNQTIKEQTLYQSATSELK